MEEHVWIFFFKVYKWAKHVFTATSLNQKDMAWKHTDSPEKKKFWAHQSVKLFMLTLFLDMNRLITTDFLEKSATVNFLFVNFWGKIHLIFWLILVYLPNLVTLHQTVRSFVKDKETGSDLIA